MKPHVWLSAKAMQYPLFRVLETGEWILLALCFGLFFVGIFQL